MRIAFTGGGTGGHFYPLIAVASELRKTYGSDKLSLFYIGEDKYNAQDLIDNQIQFVHVSAGKKRTYSSPLNFLDNFKILWGIVQAMLKLPIIYPDVIFSKGGYVAFPVLFAARILRIPVVIHDSDTVPGRTSVWSAKFSKFVCVAWNEAKVYFVNRLNIPEKRVIYTGLPLRKEINPKENIGAVGKTFTGLSNNVPTILVIGGSQGSELLNDSIIKGLGVLLKQMQIIHQTGPANHERVKKLTDKLLENFPERDFYHVIGNIDQKDLRFLYSKILLVVARGGSQILEFNAWGIPSIIVPISNSNGNHQRENAYSNMASGAGVVIEEKNLTPKILENEILRLIKNSQNLSDMVINSRKVARYDAAQNIANILLSIAESH